jgi:hypothetical protein
MPRKYSNGYDEHGCIIIDHEKHAAFLARWDETWSSRWELRDGKYYPRAKYLRSSTNG